MSQSMKQDLSFGNKGIIIFSNGRYNEVKEVVPAIANTHVFVLIESATVDGNRDCDIVIIKLSLEGKLDATFGDDGIVKLDFFGMDISRPAKIQVLKDGKLLIAGDGCNSTVPDKNLSCLIKLLPNGSIDKSFGMEGTLPVQFGSASYVSALHLNKDSSVFIAGNYLMPFGNHIDVFPSMGKIQPNGKIDTTFGKTGKVWMDFYQGVFSLVSTKHTAGGEINDVLVLPNGKILICGGFLFSYTYEGFIARLNADGTLDKSFNNKGYLKYDFTPGKFNVIKKMILLDEHTVLIGANSQTDYDSDFYFGIFTLGDSKLVVSRIDFKGQHDILEDISLDKGEVIMSGRSILPEHVEKRFRSDYCVLAKIKDPKNPKDNDQIVFSLDKENQNGIMAHAVLNKKIIVAGFVHTSNVYVKDVVVSCFKRK
jgi:uncharacterized delta-60 repeat protein